MYIFDAHIDTLNSGGAKRQGGSSYAHWYPCEFGQNEESWYPVRRSLRFMFPIGTATV